VINSHVHKLVPHDIVKVRREAQNNISRNALRPSKNHINEITVPALTPRAIRKNTTNISPAFSFARLKIGPGLFNSSSFAQGVGNLAIFPRTGSITKVGALSRDLDFRENSSFKTGPSNFHSP
jgi:hypothetical protein